MIERIKTIAAGAKDWTALEYRAAIYPIFLSYNRLAHGVNQKYQRLYDGFWARRKTPAEKIRGGRDAPLEAFEQIEAEEKAAEDKHKEEIDKIRNKYIDAIAPVSQCYMKRMRGRVYEQKKGD